LLKSYIVCGSYEPVYKGLLFPGHSVCSHTICEM